MKLKKMRAITNLTQKEVAEILHCNVSYISKIENGKNMPNLKTLVTLANLYKCPISGLIEGLGYNLPKIIYTICREKDKELIASIDNCNIISKDGYEVIIEVEKEN